MRLPENRSDVARGRTRVRLLAVLVLAVLSPLGVESNAGENADRYAVARAPDGVVGSSSEAADARDDADTRTAREPASRSGAGNVRDTLYTVPTIVVEAPRIRRGEYDVFRRSGFVAVLHLGGRRDRVEDLASILSQTVGVQVRQYGGLGSFATVSVRGSSSNQVDLYLDGIPLGDPYSGVANLGDLPLDGIDRVEVYRGFSPPHLGSSAIGGVINLRTVGLLGQKDTPQVSTRTNAEARVSYGSFGTERYVASLWPSIGKVNAFIPGSFLRTEGNFTFFNDNRTWEDPGDDGVTTRINNHLETGAVLARVETRVPVAGRLSLGHNSLVRENGVPGVGSDQSTTARSERVAHRTYLELDPDARLGGRLDLLASAHYSTSNEKFYDPGGDIALARQDTDNDFRTYGGSLRSMVDLSRVTLELLFDGRGERFRPKSNIPTPTEGPDRKREALTTAISADVLVDRLKVVLNYTGRLHWQRSEFYHPPRFPWLPPQPQGRVSGDRRTSQYGFRFLPTSFLTVKGNWGEYYRLPTFLELFGNTGSVTGSFDLEPEKGLNRDIGVVLTFDRVGLWRRFFFEAVYLDNEVEDLILFFPNSQFTARPQNIGSARIRGCEVSFSSLFSDWLRLAGNYTYLDGKDTGPIPHRNGNELPGRPKHDLAVFADLTHRAGELSYEYHRISENYLDPANQLRVPSRDIHNLALRWNGLGRGLSLTLEGRNLTNDRVSDVSGFPLPGRSYFVTVSYRYLGG